MSKPAAESSRLAAVFFCISLNPAVDTRLVLNRLLPGRVNRVVEVYRTPGGKAAHVAMALTGLGAAPTWIGFAGGAIGSELLAGLRSLKIESVSVPTVQSSRVNLEILDTHGEVTEILEPGGTITQSEWNNFQQTCSKAFQVAAANKIAVISGSLPPGVPNDACSTLTSAAHSANCLVFVDSSGQALSKALPAEPDFVKVNREEAEVATQIAVHDPLSAALAVRKLIDQGAKSAAVSLGEGGLVAVQHRDGRAIHAWTDPLHPKSTVGCGDSALAGFAFAAASGLSFERSLVLAVACGTANCLATRPARIQRQDVSRIEQQVHNEMLKEK
jgi:1-phosphofructokinase family hexose kinase